MRIIFKNIKNFIFHHQVIFTIFILSQMVSTIAILYVTSVFQASQIEDKTYNDGLRTFTVVFHKPAFPADLGESFDEVLSLYGNRIRQLIVYAEQPRIKSNYIYPSDHHQSANIGKYFDRS